MLPAIILVSFFITNNANWGADWGFYLNPITQESGYPLLSPLLTNFMATNGLLLPYVIAITVIIPYILLLAITKRELPGLAYLYLSGLPFILLWGGFVAQALIHILILLSILSPIGSLLLLFLGPLIHREWLAALILSALIWIALNKDFILKKISIYFLRRAYV